jgi:hypothetical protein
MPRGLLRRSVNDSRGLSRPSSPSRTSPVPRGREPPLNLSPCGSCVSGRGRRQAEPGGSACALGSRDPFQPRVRGRTANSAAASRAVSVREPKSRHVSSVPTLAKPQSRPGARLAPADDHVLCDSRLKPPLLPSGRPRKSSSGPTPKLARPGLCRPAKLLPSFLGE